MKLYSLFNKKEFFINPGLERIKEASAYYGDPHKRFRSVLISGTNGKGSTAVFLESLFRHHGLKTGLFTSPHLIKENERWQINRVQISDKKLDFYIEKIKPAIEKFNLTYFEACTLLAFLYFAYEKVDIAVLEVGLGGRWDATNIVEPEFSIITNVSLDHTHILGDTIHKIAREKFGIVREDKPLILGSNQKELLDLVNEKKIKQVFVFGKDFKVDINNLFPVQFNYRFRQIHLENLELSLIGRYQAINSATALTGFLVYSKNYSLQKIRKALKDTHWTGRFEILSKDPLVIVDGAHNEDAVKKAFYELKAVYPDKKIITVYSGMKDKDIKNILSIIKENSDTVIITSLPFDRGITKDNISDSLEFDFVDKPQEALKKALKHSGSDTVVFITGSLYLIGQVLDLLKEEG